MSRFHKTLRAYAADQIAKPGEHKRQEIADRFLDDNPEIAHEFMRALASKQIAELIKSLCDEPEADPLPIFSGFPAAITVADGVVKATEHCVLGDLGAGLENRNENVRHALKKLEAYRDSMAAYESLRGAEDETVGECTKRLREQGPITEDQSP